MEQSVAVAPELFWQTVTALQSSVAIKAAIELDVFTKIADGSRTSEAIAEACPASSRGIRILCDALTVLGFLAKQNNQYDLTEMSAAFLNRHSQIYLGCAIGFILSPIQMRGFADLTNAVKKGGSNVTGKDSLAPDSPMWVKFARGMMPMMMPAAQMIAANLGFEPDRKLKVLDIAAGHGIFGITVAQK